MKRQKTVKGKIWPTSKKHGHCFQPPTKTCHPSRVQVHLQQNPAVTELRDTHLARKLWDLRDSEAHSPVILLDGILRALNNVHRPHNTKTHVWGTEENAN